MFRFSFSPSDPYSVFRWVERQSKLSGSDGKSQVTATITVPSGWSQAAVNMLAQKYMRRAGVPSETYQVEEPGVPSWLWCSAPTATAVYGGETDARQVFNRLAGAWAYTAWKEGYFKDEAEAKLFHNEVRYMLAAQVAAPASPQWFNTGLYWAYNIEGDESGLWAVDSWAQKKSRGPGRFTVFRSDKAYTSPQVHACFIQSVNDDLVSPGGIMDLWVREARVFKFGGGSGSNFSQLRAAREPLSGGGCSSGTLSWLRIGDRAAGAIKSGGTTRRAAKMVILDIDHPDIEEFIGWKTREENKVAALVIGSALARKHAKAIYDAEGPSLAHAVAQARADGVPPQFVKRLAEAKNAGASLPEIEALTVDWDREAYASVSGQNANNSVRASNEQMRQMLDGKPIGLYGRVERRAAKRENREPLPSKKVDGGALWRSICEAAWTCADPGLHFSTTVNEWNTCLADGEIVASNPCGEYLFLDDTGCNLASLNLVRFLRPMNEAGGTVFDTEAYVHACEVWAMVLDITVSMAGYPSEAVAKGSANYRTMGLGYCNVGALLMQLGIPYDSDEGRGWIAGLTACMHFAAGTMSGFLASRLGAFPRYEENKKTMTRVVANHVIALGEYDVDFHGLEVRPKCLSEWKTPLELRKAAYAAAERCSAAGRDYGYRNAQWTLLAPTGTIALLMDADTTGIEPDFSLVKFKQLAGGGFLKIINQSVEPALVRLGYDARQCIDILTYAVGTPRFAGAPHGLHKRLGELYDEAQIASFEERLPGLVDVRLGLPPELLQGYSAKEIADINRHLCGAMTLEGAPHLKAEHLPVFDCANRCGAEGKRCLSVDAHLLAMAAAQPFLSGAISKTINMPADSTVAMVSEAYRRAWTLALKDVALYRDGSKLSQPLNGGDKQYAEAPMADVAKVAERTIVRFIGKRRNLPYRRSGDTVKMRLAGQPVYLRTGEYADGTLGEIWIDLHKTGASLRAWANCFAIAVSLGLQYGVPLEEFVEVFTDVRFEPAGIVGNHPTIKTASSIIDLLFKELAATYLNQARDEAPVDLRPHKTQVVTAAVDAARLKGYEGEVCSHCGMFALVRAGACLKCDACGSTSGCG